MAIANANLVQYEYQLLENHLSVPEFLTLADSEPFRFQRAELIFYVPKNKKLIMDPNLGKMRFGNRYLKINTDWDDLDDETKTEIRQEVNEAMNEVNDAMDEVSENLSEVTEELNDMPVTNDASSAASDELRKETARTKAKIRIEKQSLRLKKEQLKLEQMQQELEAAN